MKRLLLLIFVCNVLTPIIDGVPSIAEVSGPGWICGSAEPVSLEDADEYFSSNAQKEKRNNSVLISTAISPEIADLARALNYSVSRISDYVLQNIEFVPYFGSRKGATQTLLDRCGNDFDMASLLVALLRASGFTADFVYATTQYYTETLSNWFGVDVGDLPRIIPEIWGGGGSPFSVVDNGGVFEGIYSKIVFARVVIDGQNIFIGPTLRKFDHPKKPMIDIGTAMGYDRTGFLNALTAGASTNVYTTQNLNYNNVNTKLTEYSTNLINTLHDQYPNSDVSDILGGRQRGVSSINGTFWSGVLWEEIPAEYTAILRIQHMGIDHTFVIPEIAGKRLTITYNNSNNAPELRLEGMLIASGEPTVQGSKNEAIITINHPYVYDNGTYMDQSGSVFLISGSTYALITSLGNINDNLIKNRVNQLRVSLKENPADSEPVIGESLNVIGFLFAKEGNCIQQLVANMFGDSIRIPHHSISVVKQEQGCVIDNRFNGYSIISRDQDDTMHSMIYSHISSSIISALEHTVLEQMMGSDIPAVSTVKLMYLANEQGKKIFAINNQSLPLVLPQLYGYSAELLKIIQDAASAGVVVVLPEDGALEINQWKGAGIAIYGGAILMGISGNDLGGASSILGPVNGAKTVERVSVANPDISNNAGIYSHTSAEPVDMSSGAYLYDRTDIALGMEPPLGLCFQRSYNSSRSDESRLLGHGWQHNNDIYLDIVSDEDPCLGFRTPVDMAALVTSFYAISDIIEHDNGLLGHVLSYLCSKWALDRIIDNAVMVNEGGLVSEYIKLPDGAYNGPPGITDRLVDNGNGTFTVKERFGGQMDFNTDKRISQLKDVDGNTLNFTYDSNKLVNIQDAVGRSLTLTYTGDNLTSVSDSSGRSVSYAYDEHNNLAGFTDLAGKLWTYGYDDQYQMVTLTNPLSVIMATNTYDALGRVKTQTVPRQDATATYNFYFSEFRTAEEDPYGNKTTYLLDEKGRTYAVLDALVNREVYEFDGQNHETAFIDELLNTIRYGYDGAHNITLITDALNKVTNITYDGQFRLTDITDPLAHTTHFGYDTLHHLISMAYPEENITGYSYYANGNLKTLTDGRGITTTFTYDANNHLRTMKTTGHPDITYLYDTIGRLLTVTDQEGAVTAFTYDARGLLLTCTDPLGKMTYFYYDDTGRLTSYTDRNNNTTTYTYTPSDKVRTVTYPDSSTVAFTYNLHDKVTSMQDAAGTTTYTYDEVYRLKSAINPYGQTVAYEYDKAGNVIKITYPDAKTVTYTYDALNRLKTVTDWQSHTATYNYDESGRLTSVANFNGTVTVYGYDDADRMITLTNKTVDPEKIISSYTYTLDSNDNIVQVVQSEQLAPVTHPSVIDYIYNAVRNRLLKTGLINFTYDDEGMVTSKENNTYSYDYENRLKSITGTENIQFTYDGMGNRIQAVRNGEVTRYIYDLDGNLIAEADSANVITRYYIHGMGLMAMATQSGQTYTYHYNGIGSTVAMTDQNKVMVNKYSYAPFGSLTNAEETVPQPFKFAGASGAMQEVGGLVLMGDGVYDPATSRFLTPTAGVVGAAGGNPYALAGNNPMGAPASAPALSPELYAGAGVYEAAKAGGEKKGISRKGKNKPQRSKYWQYFTKGWKKFKSAWFVKGKNGRPPYKLGKEAREALNLPKDNKGTVARPYKPRTKNFAGPRHPLEQPNWDPPINKKGSGWEYYDGPNFPDK